MHGDEATYYIGPVEIETNQGDVTETHSIYSLGGGVNAVRVVASPGDDGEVTFTFGDHLGSSSTVWQTGELGDTDPGVRSYQRYYPYGEPRDDYSPALPTDHTFTGQISDGLLDDGGTGLMYYGARYYDPQVGRFAAADTIVPNPGNPQDLNRYAYVSNNPVNMVDPSGHDCAWWQWPWCHAYEAGKALFRWGYYGENPLDPQHLHTKDHHGGNPIVVAGAAASGEELCGVIAATGATTTVVIATVGTLGSPGGAGSAGSVGGSALARGVSRIVPPVAAGAEGGRELVEAIGELIDEAFAGSEGGGTVVLGSVGEYEKLAEQIPDAIVFSLPEDVVSQLSRTELWELNERFLDDAVANGYDFVLASEPPVGWMVQTFDPDVTRFFVLELQYLAADYEIYPVTDIPVIFMGS